MSKVQDLINDIRLLMNPGSFETVTLKNRDTETLLKIIEVQRQALVKIADPKNLDKEVARVMIVSDIALAEAERLAGGIE